jgi:hypothetical protein
MYSYFKKAKIQRILDSEFGRAIESLEMLSKRAIFNLN